MKSRNEQKTYIIGWVVEDDVYPFEYTTDVPKEKKHVQKS